VDFDSDLTQVWLVLCAAMTVHACLLKRLAIGVIDPIVYTAVGTTAAIAMSFAISGASLEFLRVVVCVALFWAGAWWTWPARRVQPTVGPVDRNDVHQRQFTRILVIATILFVAANAAFFAVAGPPAFGDNPSLAKVESYAGGFGIVRRLNWGLGVFVAVGLTYLLLTTRPRWAKWAYAVFIAISALSGSKSALIPVLFAFALYRARADIRAQAPARSRWLKWLLPLLVLGAVGAGLGVLVVEQGDFGSAVVGFLRRLLYSSDVLIYWETPQVQHFFRGFDVFDYLKNVLEPILGELRLVDYSMPIGSQMVQLSLGAGDDVSESLGPNAPFYVKGEIFFGPGQYVYCVLVGATIGWLRRRYARTSVHRPFALCVSTTFVLLSTSMAIDDALFVSTASDFLVMLGLVCLAAALWPLRRSREPAMPEAARLQDP
jgi:hypothetical protein